MRRSCIGLTPAAAAKTWLAERAKLPPYSPPRLPDGKPNLQGRWGGSSSGDDMEETTEQVDPTTPPWESYVSNPANGRIPYQPWTLSYRLRRAGTGGGGGGGGGGAANVPDPYASEGWEHACHEGNINHVEGAQHLEFKWFPPVVPPGR